MASGELVLLYNIGGDKARKPKMIFVQNGIKIRTVAKEDFSKPLGLLSGVLSEEEAKNIPKDMECPEVCNDDEISEEMLIMKGIFGKRLDLLLAAMRKAKAVVPLKAVITEHNVFWNSIQLYHEIKREHEVMSSGKPVEEEKEE